jgi:hypothetical protein
MCQQIAHIEYNNFFELPELTPQLSVIMVKITIGIHMFSAKNCYHVTISLVTEFNIEV